MKARFLVLTALSFSLVSLSACGDTAAPEAEPAPAPSSAASSAAASTPAPVDLMVADSSLGKIVVTGEQMTAYIFTKDTANSGKSACKGDCLTAWPPITTTQDTPTVEGVTGKVGTITLDDGSRQVTINGLPLYLWQKDKAPGDVTGQAVGGVWYVVGPDGKMITKKP